VYVVDEHRRLVYCNSALEELVGIERGQLIGQTCTYQMPASGGSPGEVASSLCPPPTACGGQPVTAAVTLLHASGSIVKRHAMFVPLGVEALDERGVLVVLSASEGPETVTWVGPESTDLHARLAQLRRTVLTDCPLDELVGVGLVMQRVRDQLLLAARGPTRVLIHGPTGSGREHAARWLHRRATPEAWEPFVPLWCPLLDAELIQSTITAMVREVQARAGEKGGATRDAQSQVIRVPTVLLLEVDQLSIDAQAELAGFLALPGFELYVIATAQEPLLTLSARGEFRGDLAHLLSTLVIEMPSLAARAEDIPWVCQSLIERYNSRGGRQLGGCTPEMLDMLASYPWPGNVDELAEVITAACAAADGPLLDVRHLPDKIRWAQQVVAHPRRGGEPIVLDEFLQEIEKELIERAMRRAKGNKTQAAKMLGMTRARFHRRLEHLGLDR
jgi:DNA-binding NtrC family response regulator